MRAGNPFLIVAGLLLLGASACERSNAYRHDQGYYQDTDSYYSDSRGGKGPVQRVQAMGQPKKRVVVLSFWNDTPVKQEDLGRFAGDELKRGLFLTQRLIVNPELKTDSVTQDFLQGDQVKVAQLIREGRKLGVGVLIIGRLTQVAFRQRGDEVGIFRQKQSLAAVTVEIKLFDVSAGREILASAKQGEASSNSLVALEDGDLTSPAYRGELTKLAVRDAVAKLVPDVVRSVEKLTWQGRIAKVVGNKVYINAGRASGLIGGDILRVMAQGDDIYDPNTGALLGRTQGQLKGTLEVVDFLGPDGAVTDIHTGGNFQEDDIVQLY